MADWKRPWVGPSSRTVTDDLLAQIGPSCQNVGNRSYVTFGRIVLDDIIFVGVNNEESLKEKIQGLFWKQ